MINTFFFQMNKINGGASRPKDVPPQKTEKWVCWVPNDGAGIAYSSAMVGIQVVLKDISLEAAEKVRPTPKPYCRSVLIRANDT